MLTLSHPTEVLCVAAAGDGQVLTGSQAGGGHVKVWRGDTLARTIEAHRVGFGVNAVAVMPQQRAASSEQQRAAAA